MLQACPNLDAAGRGIDGKTPRDGCTCKSSRQSLGETTWFAPGQWLTHKNTITALRLTPVTHARVTRRVTPPAGYLGLPPPTLSTTATALVPSTLDGTLVRRVRPASDRRALRTGYRSKSEPERVEPKDSHPRPRTGAGAHEREGERTYLADDDHEAALRKREHAAALRTRGLAAAAWRLRRKRGGYFHADGSRGVVLEGIAVTVSRQLWVRGWAPSKRGRRRRRREDLHNAWFADRWVWHDQSPWIIADS